MPGPNPYGGQPPPEVAKAKSFTATAYCHDFGVGKINGQSGVTKDGTDLNDGKQHFVIAAGPGSGLSMGDLVRIDPDPISTGSVWKVADTGNLIAGRHIDVYIADCDAARRWGRKAVKVMNNPKQYGGNTAAPGETSTQTDPLAGLSAVANAIGDMVSVMEKFVEALFNGSTWFRVGKVVVGVFLGLYGLTIIARPLTNSIPPSIKTAAKVAAV